MAEPQRESERLPQLPRERVQNIVEPFVRFLHIESAGGVVLLALTCAALILANSPLADSFLAFWKTPVGFQVGEYQLRHSLQHWINDGLMAIFFFVIGLEVKRELVTGELRDIKQAILPISAAMGGMIAPAAIYLALQAGEPGSRGWGIPMATDIAFVVGCLAVMGPRIPRGLRVLLLSLAIVDDIGAIVVIAVGYTEALDLAALAWGLVGIGVIRGLAQFGVRSVPVYSVAGVVVWLAFHESGVHATIAGVILGLMTPAQSWVSEGLIGELFDRAGSLFRGEGLISGSDRQAMLRQLERASREAMSPLERLEITLHPWVGFVIMPLFALANAGVPIDMAEVGSPVSVAIMAGLVLGKPLGVIGFSLLVVKLGWAELPRGVNWGMIVGGSCLAGIGFTMALFIAGLALQDELLQTAKVGILFGSAISAVVGVTVLLRVSPSPTAGQRPDRDF